MAGYKSTYKYARISPRKVRLVTDLISNKHIGEALTLLNFSKKRAAVMVKKALESAIANADQAEANKRLLWVTEARVDEGPTIKRRQPKDRGRAHPIKKRTSHIHITVKEV